MAELTLVIGANGAGKYFRLLHQADRAGRPVVLLAAYDVGDLHLS